MSNRNQLSTEDINEQLELKYRKIAWLKEVNGLSMLMGVFQKFEMEGECLAAFWNDDCPSDFLNDQANARWLKDEANANGGVLDTELL